MTGGDLVVRCLLEQRVRTVFGIPGALNIHLYRALRGRQADVRHILVRHELGGAWMADGYSRASGDVGVVCTVPGPGASHAVSGVAGAYTECSRVLVLASQGETRWRGHLRRNLFHGLDQARLYAPVTKFSVCITRAEQIPEGMAEAFYRLRQGRPGPVYVELPADVLGASALGEVPPYQNPPRQPPDAAVVARAAAALAEARRPLILAGDGVLHSDATEELGALAHRVRAPVITTVMGKGALPEDYPWSLGDMNSLAGSQAYPQADLIFAVGCRFVQTDTRWPWFTPPPRLVHVDADPREVGRLFSPEVGMIADPKLALAALDAALAKRNPLPQNDWNAVFPALKRQSDARAEADPVVAALRRALPRETLVSWDVCYPGYRSRSDWFAYQPRGYYYPGVYVDMGFGLPVGIGARLARPECPLCVVTGDGGFQMSMPELGTAVQHRLPLVVVLVNDRGFKLIRLAYDRTGDSGHFAVDLVNPDFIALARAYGIEAERVRDVDQLETAVKRAIGRDTVTLVELAL
ncbi:MAG: thiamine pyrophosphate-binding protein [Armatimonadetes bacterium]|nr:thiamine pyrophosphate-binding protein [Armatimonadota bacterium]